MYYPSIVLIFIFDSLGIWADDSDEDERPTSFNRDNRRKNFTAPMNFVSGGVKVGDTVRKAGEDDDEDDDFKIVDSDEEAQKILEEAEKRKYGKQQRYQGRSVGGNMKDQ